MNFFAKLLEIDLFTYTQWLGILTLFCLVLTVAAFIFKWGLRFRLVGVTSFMGVVTASVFALGLGLFARTDVPGSVRYALVFDNAADKATIAIPPTVTESEVEATLRQAASNLKPYGRVGGSEGKLIIRARTMLHPEPGISQPLYLGQAERSFATNNQESLKINIFSKNFAQLPTPDSTDSQKDSPPSNRPAQYNRK
ncbi:Ycf51 family protein [Oscillatoria sp. FACHB-1406]|uniref:Ycf51 family protein n=1 Tax=Oscillatoria sp. FACHB-1406 TaxID=2692846 RepID=UPI00168441B0|nr:Ycf51 family protein [Oscillatoria sp. FACHB-1406]MBD2576875.1 Ycf51 family protein [Oscillatoria sp. FACHB-1406]